MVLATETQSLALYLLALEVLEQMGLLVEVELLVVVAVAVVHPVQLLLVIKAEPAVHI